MAIAIDATAQSGAATDFKTAFSFSHTITGPNNRVVIVGIAGRQGGSGSAVPTPTYNGVNMTLVRADGWATISGQCSGVWIIKEASLPAAGTYTVAVTMADADTSSYGVVAVSWTGVDQTTPTSGANGGNGVDATPTVTFSSALNNLVITANVCTGDPATNTFTADGTERVRNVVPNGDTHCRCIVQTKPGQASVIMAPTQTPSTWFESGASMTQSTGTTAVVANVGGVLKSQFGSPLYIGNMTS